MCDCLTGLCVRVGYGRSQELIIPPPLPFYTHGRREIISRPTSFSSVQFRERSLVVFVCLLSSPTFRGASMHHTMHFGSTFLSRLRMMLVGIWLGLYWGFFFLRSLYYKGEGIYRLQAVPDIFKVPHFVQFVQFRF